MASVNLKMSDKISGWNSQQDQQYLVSNNMLRVLQNKIISSVRLEEINIPRLINYKSNHCRPATVRVRPISPNNQTGEQINTHATMEIFDIFSRDVYKKNTKQDKINQLKFRNKSIGNNIRKKLKNKQNISQRQQNGKEKPKTQCMQIKKQQLIFNNYQSLKPKKSQKVISNFHEMQIKLRKNRLKNNKNVLLQRDYKHFQIVCEPNSKKFDIKVINGNNQTKAKDQNLFEISLQKLHEVQYTKLTRKNKILLFRQKIQKKQITKQKDLFTDTHFNQLQNVI